MARILLEMEGNPMEMHLQNNARIIGSDGSDLGTLSRFVLDPRTRRVTYIILQRGMLSRQEYVLPMDMVERIDEDAIYVKSSLGSPDELSLFQESSYVPAPVDPMSNSPFAGGNPNSRMFFYYPPAGMGSAGVTPSYPQEEPVTYGPNALNPIPVSGADEMTPVQKAEDDAPQDIVALKEGARVVSSDSKHVGNVEKLLLDARNNKTTHLLITKGLFFKNTKLVPMDWVDQIDEDEVRLLMSAEYLDQLPEYKA